MWSWVGSIDHSSRVYLTHDFAFFAALRENSAAKFRREAAKNAKEDENGKTD